MRILILSHMEICYNPRLVKAADYLVSKGHEIVIFNPVTGIAPQEVYESCINKRNWKVFEAIIRKDTLKSKLNWLFVSIINLLIKLCWDYFRMQLGHEYYLNKGLLLFPKKRINSIDIIITHVVDNLPFAAKLKKKYNAKLIYDSQEYFTGQYSTYHKPIKSWVSFFEMKYINKADMLIATTNVMLNKLKNDYNLKIPCFRVRNMPKQRNIQFFPDNERKNPLRLVWHGMTIIINNRRGVNVLLKAIAHCKSNVELTLQGLLYTKQKNILNQYINELNLKNKVRVLSPAPPDKIVESLLEYDIGLLGEVVEEENQELTSSNKLFDFINAGLCVIAPALKGLNETMNEFNVGYKYKSGDYIELAQCIDNLAFNKSILKEFKTNAANAAKKELYWENDYIIISNYINNVFTQKN